MGLSFPPFGAPPRVLLGLLSMTLILAGGYVLNQIVDRESDRANRKLFLIADGIIPLRAALAELGAVWVAAAFCAAALPVQFRLVAAASLLLNLTYSLPPARAKERAPLDLVWNGAGFGVAAFAAGWTCVGALEHGWFGVALSYALAVAGVTASTTILDIDGDRASGYRTTGALLGPSHTSALAILLLVAAAGAGVAFRDVLGLFGALLSLPLLLRAHRTRTRRDRIAANQVAVAVYALIAGIRVPLLLLLLALVYLGSRTYYRSRFGLSFPGRGTP
jgi:4-hydroxybenzoate polyprenyltransferase